MSHNDYSLFLSGSYDNEKGLDKFLLALIHPDKGQLYEWLATSSHVNGQQRGDQYQRGGLLPSVHQCLNLDKWEVDTKPLDLTHHAGVRGNFYRLLPFEVTTIAGTKRSDLGIHYDANAPGSLGCIVMNWKNWSEFDRVISGLRINENVTKIPLFPLYD